MTTHNPGYSTALGASSAFKKTLASAPKLIVILAVLAGFVSTLKAGSAPAGSGLLKFTVTDAFGEVIGSDDLSSNMVFNSDTGALTSPLLGTKPNSNWTWTDIDLLTETQLAQKVLTWKNDAANPTSAIQLKATGNVDPFMSYSFSAKNFTSANQTFTFSYGETIIPPISSTYSIYADIAGSLTHAGVTASAILTPSLGDLDGDGVAEIQTLKLSTDGGTTFVNAGVDVGLTQTRIPNGTANFGPVFDSNTGNLSNINYWQFDVAFTLTPFRDAAALSGFAQIEPSDGGTIPEPSTYALIISVFAFGIVLYQRRRATREA